MKPCEIPGWMDHDELAWLAAQGKAQRVGARCFEIGCFLGRSTAAFLSEAPEIYMAVVDTFDGRGTVRYGEMVQAGVTRNVEALRLNLEACGLALAVKVFVGLSVKAAQDQPAGVLDWIFIDATHTREAVTADLEAWWPKLRPGGTIAGHDYDPTWPDVVGAVDDFFSAIGRRAENPVHAIWAVRK